MSKSTINLGEFEIKSGKMVVSDPCYTEVPNKQKINGVLDVLKGKWKASVVMNSAHPHRVCRFIVAHQSVSAEAVYLATEATLFANDDYIKEKFEVATDSGQAGTFDKKSYKPSDEGWYDQCCGATLGTNDAGVIEGGSVASSGYGDGIYECWTKVDRDGEIVMVIIEFIADGMEDEF